MCLALRASGLWLRYATLQNLIPSFPWIAPPRLPPWRNPRKGRDQILPSGNPGSTPTLSLSQGHRDQGGRAVPAAGPGPALAAADGGHDGAGRGAGAPPLGEGLPQVLQ